ncbi:ABC transporter [Citrobacter freundii complex sp. CFNIH5]|nr:ABC transporter [Citrobacter freundii complex sp. CFNIH3]POV58598.1 ABC transporter [Citrobacter freundii complex sp. CFNIH5]
MPLSQHPRLPGSDVVCRYAREGANKQVISSQADSLIKISRIWADFFPANTSNQPI